MKFTLDWLRDFVDLPTDDPGEIAEALENLGHEVEQWNSLEPRFSGVVIGRVLEVGPHPNADKVRLARVDVGDETLDIVCGAWNFDAGAIVPVAVPGAVLQGDFEISRRKIRGVTSNGMICSEAELEIGEDAAGIMVLGDYPAAPERLGDDFASLLPEADAFFDVTITPNRPDCMSVYGLARELAAFYDVPLREPGIEIEEIGGPGSTRVTITDDIACPRFVGREVRDISIGRSPHWMRTRLTAAGVRPINNVVDASNYAMIEFGHPTHAFDLDRLGSTVLVRHASETETLVTLDDVERHLVPSDIVVADGVGAVAIAGVMGGGRTEVYADTSRVLIEAAYWNPPSILLTSKRLGLRSEASARFERGMDPNFCALAADRVAQLLQDTAGGRVAPGLADEYPRRIESRIIIFPVAEVERVLGIEVASATVTDLLERLGFGVTGDDVLEVTVPTRRPDVLRPADLVEEVARLYGFDNIPGRLRLGTGGGLPADEQQIRHVRAVMVGAGYHEVFNFSFIGASHLDALGLSAGDPARIGIPVVNPLREEEGVMRTTLLPGLLEAAGINSARRVDDVRIFEIGSVFLPGTGKLPEQPIRLGFVAAGDGGVSWDERRAGYDVYDATGVWELLADAMQLPAATIRKQDRAPFHPGRCAEVLVAGSPIGVVGEILPRVAAAFGLEGRAIAGEIDLAPLLVDRGHWEFAPPSVYPPQIFDLAFSVDLGVPASAVLAAIDAVAGEWLEDRFVFDVYEGASLGEGTKSVAVKLTMRAADRTLSDEDVAPVRRRIVEAVETATGGSLRGEV
jgi:phenylalanyl-tRNA synthetase beta chain